MDLRRFLVFFVLVFFLFSINIYSSSIFGIENITDIPDDVEDKPYILGYSNYGKLIFMCVHLSNREVKSLHIGEDGVYDQSGELLLMSFRKYDFNTDEWEYYTLHTKNSSWFTKDGLEPYFSNRDLYYNDEIYIFGKEHYSDLCVFSGLSSSVFFVSLIKPLLKLMPFVLVFIVLFFTFLKAWNFIKGVF